MKIYDVKVTVKAFGGVGWRWCVDVTFIDIEPRESFLAGFEEDEDDAYITARLAVKDLRDRLRAA